MAAKFRPSFTAQQIHYLHQLVQMDSITGTEKLKQKMDAYFRVFITKMQVGSISAAYHGTEKLSLEEQLDAADEDNATRREKAYLAYQSSPQLCTEQQIADAKLYAYEHDMMSRIEEEAYEKAMGL